MATPDMDVIKDIPGYKAILKTVLKSQIQHLVEQLSSTTDEESVILTASLSDGSLSHLGSDFGKGFIEDHKDIKSQFLSFCLKKHYGIKQQENMSHEAETVEASIQDNHAYMRDWSPRSDPLLTSSSRSKKSMGIRFEPYTMTRSRMSAINLDSASEPGQSHVKKEVDKQINKFKSKDNNKVSNLSKDKPLTATNVINDANDNDNVDDSSVQQNNIDYENNDGYPLLSVKLKAVANTIETFAEIDSKLECNDEPMGTAIETEPEIIGDEHMGTEYKTEPGIGVKSPIVMLPTPTGSNALLNMKLDSFDDTGGQYDMNEKENDDAHLQHCDNSEQSFLSNIAVQTQASVQIDTKPVICNTCGKAFDQRNLSTFPSGNHIIVKPSQCETCSSECTLDGRQFNRRIVEKRETNGYKCEDCGKCFPYNSLLKAHLSSHRGIKPFKCETCETTFTQKRSLTTHINLHSGVKPFKCDICGKPYADNCSLTSHIAARHVCIRPFKCDKCEKSYIKKNDLTRHMIVHSGVKPFKCDICEKSFTLKGDLTRHMLVHSGVKGFTCDICEKSFTLKCNLKSHMLVHFGVKRFKCETCGKLFTHKGDLARHMFVHSGEKRFKCDICEKSFTLKHYLKSHMLVHSGVKNFKCDKCEKSFTHKCDLKKHIAKHS